MLCHDSPPRLHLALGAILLFACALLGQWRRTGSSPALWVDTLNDERQVANCMADEGRCELHGAPVSFGGLVQGASWQQMRSVALAAGLGLSFGHWLWLVLEAVALALMVLVGFRLGGIGGGLAACLFLLLGIEHCECWRPMHWNFRPLSTIGILSLAIMLRLGSSNELRRGQCLAGAGLLGVLAGIALNIHLIAAVLLPGALSALLLGAKHRWSCLSVALSGFFLVLLLSSPAAWAHNFSQLFEWNWLPVGGSWSAIQAAGPSAGFWRAPPFLISGIAALLLIVALFRARAGQRTTGWILLAVLGSAVALFAGGQSFLQLTHTDRYLLPALPAAALAAAWAWGQALGPAGSRLLKRLNPSVAFGMMVLVSGLALCAWPDRGNCDPNRVSIATRDSLWERLEADGWSSSQARFRVRGPKIHQVLEGMPESGDKRLTGSASSGVELFPWHLVGPGSKREIRDNLQVLGEQWLLLPLNRRVDWSKFQLCTQSGCQVWDEPHSMDAERKPGYQLEGLPDPARTRGELRLRTTISARAEDEEAMVYWSPSFSACRAEISASDCPDCVMAQDKRLLIVPAAVEASLELRYQLGGADCPIHAYQGFPPWVAELPRSTYEIIRENIEMEPDK